MGIDPMMNARVLLAQKWCAAAGTPDSGMPLGFETRHSTHRRQGNIETNHRHSRRYEQAQRVTRTQPSGITRARRLG
jgi:hypothetical protein